MQSSNRRTDYRVAVPEAYLRELAIWFCPGRDYVRLSAAELGRPHLALSKMGKGSFVLMDLSIRGLGLHATLPPEVASKLLAAKTCFIYLKLWDPSVDDPYGELSVFTYNQLTRVAQTDSGLLLGSHFLRFAVGSRLEKTLEFLDARTCGVSHLAHWCDNILRGGFSGTNRFCSGLDMDNLLDEIEAALAHPCTAEEETT